MEQLSQQTRMWVEFQLGGVILSESPLKGGMSSQMTLLEIELRSGKTDVVLREYTDTEWLALEPDIAFQEAKNLNQAEQLSVTTPVLIAFDHKGESTTYPSLLMSKVEGEVVLKPLNVQKWTEQLALSLVKIHQFEGPTITHQYFRYFDPDQSVTAEWSSRPEKWKRAFTYLSQRPHPADENTFIHRDYHPTNVLFNNEEVSAVVDWTNACIGPKQIDIAHCRWNLAMMYGQKSADLFLEAYKKASPGLDYTPYWDLEALGNVFSEDAPEVYGGWSAFGLKELTEELMIQRMDDFLSQALKQIERTQ